MNGKDAFFDPVPDMGQEVEEPLNDELAEPDEEVIEEASEPERDLLQHYINEARRITLLDPEEERRYLLQYQSDDEAKKNEAHAVLVRHNLRLVIRIAFDFKKYWMSNMLDLIQEGNIGLMHAIKKFEPDRGIKLSYYASFWIKAYILSFLIKNLKLVRIGKTGAQRKIFFNLKREKERLRELGFEPNSQVIAENLGVKESEVDEMEQRLSGRELSLDAPLREGSKENHLNFLPAIEPQIVNTIAEAKKEALLHQYLAEFRSNLRPKELDILNLRLLADKPLRLEAIGGLHQVSRERIRQIEAQMIQKFGIFLKRKETEEKKQWAKNLIKNLIRERDEKKSKRFMPIRQSGCLNDEFTIKWINPDEIDPPAKSDKNGLEKTEAPSPPSGQDLPLLENSRSNLLSRRDLLRELEKILSPLEYVVMGHRFSLFTRGIHYPSRTIGRRKEVRQVNEGKILDLEGIYDVIKGALEKISSSYPQIIRSLAELSPKKFRRFGEKT